MRVRDDGTLLVAVADGAGSAPRSEDGAELAAQQVVSSIDGLLTLGSSRISETSPAEGSTEAPVDGSHVVAGDTMDEIVHVAVGTAIACIEALAEAAKEPLRSFACTLSCAVVTNESVTTAQVGDGLIVMRDLAERLVLVGEPQRGEYANETPMLTSNGAIDHLVVHTLHERATGVSLTTDGLLRLAADTSTMRPHEPFFNPLFSWLDAARDDADCARLEAFLASERVSSRTDDDKTLVLAVRGR